MITARVSDERAIAILHRTVPDDQVFMVKQQALEQVEALA